MAKEKHGGSRPGAGQPKKAVKKLSMSISIYQADRDAIEQAYGCRLSQAIERYAAVLRKAGSSEEALILRMIAELPDEDEEAEIPCCPNCTDSIDPDDEFCSSCGVNIERAKWLKEQKKGITK